MHKDSRDSAEAPVCSVLEQDSLKTKYSFRGSFDSIFYRNVS